MPGGSTLPRGNMLMAQALNETITAAASVGAGASVTSTYTIPGLVMGDLIDLYFQAAITAPLAVGAVWVSAPNVLSVQWVNASASTSSGSPTAVVTTVLVNRIENYSLAGQSGLPSAVI
jgi:hypothetical protein